MQRGQRHLLVIEDDQDFIETLGLVLPAHGYTLRAVSDAETLETALPGFPATVALVDVRLRKGSGLELAAEVKGRRPALLIVVMTAYPALDSAVEALRTGVYDYLRKPFTPAELLATLDRCFERVELDQARQAAERARRRSDGRLRALVESSLDAVVISDRHGTFKFVSPSGRQLLGHERPIPTRPRLGDLVHPEDLPRARAALAECAASEGETRTLELRVRHHDGSWRWFEAAARALLSEPAIRGILISARDITARRAMEEQLRQSQRMEAIGQLTGGIAHDFNNLLTIVVGNLDLLRREVGSDGRQRELVDSVYQAAERGAALVRHLLAFSRKQTLSPRALDPNSLVRDTIELLKRSLGARIRLDMELEDGLWPCNVDAAQLQSALLNLAVNARDAMPQGGRLLIATRNTFLHDDVEVASGAGVPHVCVSVADTGTGVPAEIQQRIFEPFFSTKDPGHGTGLGLSMVFGFVKQSKGRIRLDSGPGMGTIFSLYFPRTEVGVPLPRPERADPIPRARGESVLLVDDDPDVRAVIARVLERLGYQVASAESGPAALGMLGEGLVADLLVTDVALPQGLSGYDLAARARAMRPDLRILFTAGGPADPPDGRMPAGTTVVGKPFHTHDLAVQVRRALDREAGRTATEGHAGR
jgi:PAS domain S-box-containing protein